MTRESKRGPTKMADRWHAKGALFSVLALMGCFPAFANERLVIPFEVNEYHHMVVHLEVNGNDRTTGIIDTAATFPMINRRTARLAELLDVEENPPLINVLGLTGEGIYPVVELETLLIGNVMKQDVPVALNVDMDVTGAQNVLPASAFEGDVIDFDFENMQVMVYDGRPDRSVRRVSSSLKYADENGLIFVEVRINGRKGRALIDTGSSVTFINSRFAESSHTKTNEEKTQILQGATGGDQSLRVASLRVLEIGDYRVSDMDILVSDPPLFEYLGMHEEPAMVIGLDLLSSFRLQIDRRRNRVVLSLPTSRRFSRGLNFNARDTNIPEF
ncbi:aspartyl protease family protein [Hyphomonas adhaerens]|uniref:aspartyl protease family protein n=1 Tax=Hyphomonas adhaerens TaxID=81029 RepID=UPI00235244FE|nr:aspartyl protease family protein [Hyphomonas adhaerens]